MQTPDQLVVYARQIAIYRAYDNLENELQPLDVLNAKLEHEQQEFADAVATKDIWHQYHEAADLLYYSACIAEQIHFAHPHSLQHWTYIKELRETIAGAGLDKKKAEKAALVKYGWRAAAPGNKDEDFEIELIRNAW